jgi:YD repeat-containing protein
VNQLLSENSPGYSCSYTFDANGNRLSKTLNNVATNYTYDAGDKMTAAGAKSYTYDAAGRTTGVTVNSQTTSITYDYEDRITQISYPGGATNTFTYNALDVGDR